MKYAEGRQLNPAHKRVTDGGPCGDLSLCDGCGWPFPRRRSPGAAPVCSDCRLDEAERFAAVLHLVGVRRRAWDRDYSRRDLTPPPDLEDRIRRYAARASVGAPLFGEG
jgi:hypothetical protein